MKIKVLIRHRPGRSGSLACVLLLGVIATTSLQAENRSPPSLAWRESTLMPEPRDGYAAGVIDGRLILIGGTYWEGTKDNWVRKMFSASTHAFDPKSQAWEKLGDAPVTLGYPATTQVGQEIFVVGGIQNGKPGREVYALRKVGHGFEWRHHSQLPETRLFANAVAVGQKIYVIGGTREFEPFDAKGTCCTSKTAVNTVWVLNTTDASRTWQPLAGYPGERRWLQSAASDGTAIYLFGGVYSEAQNAPAKKFNDVLRYDLATGRWARIADFPESLQSAAPVSVRGKIIFMGAKKIVMCFDPKTASFSPLDPLPQDAMVSHFIWIDPLLVGAGGENTIDGPRRRSEWTFIGHLSER